MVDNVDLDNELPVAVNSDKVYVLALLLNNEKWFARIYTVGKKVLLYVG